MCDQEGYIELISMLNIKYSILLLNILGLRLSDRCLIFESSMFEGRDDFLSRR